MKSPTLIFGILLLTFASCKRDKAEPDNPISLKMEGYIRESQTTKNISNTIVRVLRHETGKIGGFPNFIILGEAISDTNGYYKLEIDTKYNEDLFLDVEHKNYRYFPQQRMKVKTEYLRQDINLYIPGFIQIYFNNTKPAEHVSISISVENSNNHSGVTGVNVNGGGFFRTIAGKNVKIYYTVKRNNISTRYTDSIDVPFRDTVTYIKDY
jgi:hypothetical protein